MPGATANFPLPPSPWAIEQAERERAARARAAKAKGWAQFNPKDPTDSIEGVYEAGTEDYEGAGLLASFTAEQLAQGRTIRKWHPFWKADLSSYIYHYTDLLDASGELIAQHLDAEDIT